MINNRGLLLICKHDIKDIVDWWVCCVNKLYLFGDQDVLDA